jgi:hypothetical protein
VKRRTPALSAVVVVRVALWLALAVVGVGVGLQFGLGYGLIVFGVLAAVVLQFATDVDEPVKPGRR